MDKQERLVSWKPPVENFVKLNVDGSSLGNPGRSGCGGLIRNSDGEWLLGFSGFCGYDTNLKAELLAISKGLNLAWEAGYRFINCESDSMMALDLVSKGVSKFHPYALNVDHIRGLMFKDWSLSFYHTLREGNECADWMTKQGSSSDSGFVVWESCPMQLSSVLLANAIGVERTRSVF